MSKSNGKAMEAFLEDAGAGTENVTAEDLEISRLQICQKASSHHEKDSPTGKYIPGIQIGDILNSSTNQFWSGEEGVTVIPLHYVRMFKEWGEGGSGFFGAYSLADPIARSGTPLNDYGKDRKLDNGNELHETATFYLHIVMEDGMLEGVLCDMRSSGLKVARQWLTTINAQKHKGVSLAAFSSVYQLTTEQKFNASNQSWHAWKVERKGYTSMTEDTTWEHYEVSRDMYQNIKAGTSKLAAPVRSAALEVAEDLPF